MKTTPTIPLAELERLFQICDDTKKAVAYNKHAGQWSWVDRDETDNPEAHHGGFDTALEAMQDAAAPYLEGDEDGDETAEADPLSWEDNSIQFPRLIAEADMAGAFTPKALEDMAESMSLEREQVLELIGRASDEFDAIKAALP